MTLKLVSDSEVAEGTKCPDPDCDFTYDDLSELEAEEIDSMISVGKDYTDGCAVVSIEVKVQLICPDCAEPIGQPMCGEICDLYMELDEWSE